MPWVERKKIAYKVVSKVLESNLPPPYRIESDCEMTKRLSIKKDRIGTILKYEIGAAVTSPNGLCCCHYGCCRGIYAYPTLTDARINSGADCSIIKVRATKWWQANEGSRLRALSVKVIKEM